MVHGFIALFQFQTLGALFAVCGLLYTLRLSYLWNFHVAKMQSERERVCVREGLGDWSLSHIFISMLWALSVWWLLTWLDALSPSLVNEYNYFRSCGRLMHVLSPPSGQSRAPYNGDKRCFTILHVKDVWERRRCGHGPAPQAPQRWNEGGRPCQALQIPANKGLHAYGIHSWVYGTL